ncbi:NADPH-dependent FMN reductase [Geomicrobium sp. JSM 1781026]|uniref:NADPH-dependent FMN reductase n=1 Tax=Geomicrobium sp. JSM 1781026 TaxID=3344580 RepID=UPI0035C10757
MKKVLILSGSLDNPSRTLILCKAVQKELEKDFEVHLVDLSVQTLPYADSEYHHKPRQHPDKKTRDLVMAAHEADGIILASPLYHNSYSGILKNALDSLAIEQFYMKPVGLLSNGGGIRNVQALDHLRIVVRGLSGLTIPFQISTCKSDFEEVNEGFILVNEDIKRRVFNFSRQFKEVLSQKSNS